MEFQFFLAPFLFGTQPQSMSKKIAKMVWWHIFVAAKPNHWMCPVCLKLHSFINHSSNVTRIPCWLSFSNPVPVLLSISFFCKFGTSFAMSHFLLPMKCCFWQSYFDTSFGLMFFSTPIWQEDKLNDHPFNLLLADKCTRFALQWLNLLDFPCVMHNKLHEICKRKWLFVFAPVLFSWGWLF